jgi:hypothetical protein
MIMKTARKNDENRVEYGTISLPKPLIDKIKKRTEGTGMNSVSAYVTFVLRQVLSTTPETGQILDKKAEDDIKSRLKSLGYVEHKK